jgi:hypothetical protein
METRHITKIEIWLFKTGLYIIASCQGILILNT